MFSNPGMEKMYTGDLTDSEREQFRLAVRASVRDLLDTGKDGLTMHANCAWATKR